MYGILCLRVKGSTLLIYFHQIRLTKINKIKDHFIVEIREREAIREANSKYIAAYDFFDKALILSATSVGISFASFPTIIGAPVGIASASFNFAFSLITGILKNCQKQNEKRIKRITRL